MTASERLAFTLRHVEGLSIREVATAMGLKSEAAKNSIFRAVRKMRAALEPFSSRKPMHVSEEDLILHYYGEAGPATAGSSQHVSTCAVCQAEFARLQRVLSLVDEPHR